MSARLSRWIGTLLLALGTVTAAQISSATTLDLSSGNYYDNVVPTPSNTLAVWDFAATAAGTVTVNVTDLKLGDLLTALSTSIALFDGRKLQLDGTSSAMFDIGANQRFTTSIYAQTSGSKGWSAYNLTLSYSPKVSEVPLPLGAWLLVSGCGLIATRVRRKHTNAIHANG